MLFRSTLPSSSTSKLMSDAAHSSGHATAVEENQDPLPIPPHTATQMLPLVQYARQSPPLLPSIESGMKTSHTQTNPLPANSTTQTKRTCRRPQFPSQYEIAPPFEQQSLEGPTCQSPSLTMTQSTGHLSLPLQECGTTSTVTTPTVATRTSSRLKRSSELAELSSTEGPLMMTKKQRFSVPNWTTSEGWNWERSRIPLHHHHPLMSPFRHQPYCATRKSRPVLWPPVPESTQWPADRLHPSRRVPVDHGVKGLKLVTWELEYRLFQQAFKSELSCCLLTRQEELKRHLP